MVGKYRRAKSYAFGRIRSKEYKPREIADIAALKFSLNEEQRAKLYKECLAFYSTRQ